MLPNHFSVEDAIKLGNTVAADWGKITLSEFHLGLNMELEQADESDTEELLAGRVLHNILNFPNYYSDSL